MHVEHITSWLQLAALEAEWNALACDMPFCSWDWLATWWKHYSGDAGGERPRELQYQRQLYTFAVYAAAATTGGCQRQLVGIAPWFIERSAIKGNVVYWLGNGEVCTDHVSIICASHDVDQVSTAIADAMTTEIDDWDRLELTSVDSDDSGVERLMTSLQEQGNSVSKGTADQYWVLELPPSWEDYLASISKSHRKQLRQLVRRVLESDRVVWHRVHNTDELKAAWTVLVDLHQRRRNSLGEPGCFASQTFHDYHREVAERFLDRGQLRMSWLELDGTPAAAEYHLADRVATYAYQGGVDPDRLDEESGRLSTILCLRQAIDESHQRVDFLRGDEPYKAHWRATPRPTWNYIVLPNRRLARLRGQVWNVAGALGDLARQSARLVTPEGKR